MRRPFHIDTTSYDENLARADREERGDAGGPAGGACATARLKVGLTRFIRKKNRRSFDSSSGLRSERCATPSHIATCRITTTVPGTAIPACGVAPSVVCASYSAARRRVLRPTAPRPANPAPRLSSKLPRDPARVPRGRRVALSAVLRERWTTAEHSRGYRNGAKTPSVPNGARPPRPPTGVRGVLRISGLP
ncbi:hypothetical protein EVAR_19600_1 [Eumeta japonica]|uniref:Uncharacterized protein n=1 Tax=Eumeta variegata TaxID=151549 RepID=A0A4C1UFK6_EUMVA|nr:hypothetical protein EVAR_19600_1 [Eumeta japonica]